MNDLPSAMAEDHQHKKNLERGVRNREEIDRNHVHHMVFQERLPRLRRRCGLPTRNQIGHRSLGYLDSQFEQLAMNPWCSPERVGVRHSANKISDLRTDRRPAGTFTSGLELPKQLETLSVPPNDSLGFDDDQSLPPIAPETTKHDPEKTVFCSNLRPFLRTFQDGQLLAERKVFQSQIGILLGSQNYVQNQFQQHLHHGCKLCRPV